MESISGVILGTFFDFFVYPFLGSGGVWKCSWAIYLRPGLIWAPTEPYGPISDKISFFPNFIGRQIPDFFLNCRSPHLATLINIWHIWEDGSKSWYERTRFEKKSLKLLTCYKPSRSKTLSERVYGFHLFQELFKVCVWSSVLKLHVLGVNTQKRHLCRRLELPELRRTTA